MVRVELAATLLAAATAVSARPNAGKAALRTVPGAFIFEFDDAEDSSEVMGTLSVEGTTRQTFNYELFKGVSVQLDDLEKAEEKAMRMAAMPAVKNMWPVQIISRPNPIVEWIGAPTSDNLPAMLRKRDNETDTFSPHVMTQVDKLRAEGITGKGISVAVIDTGIDYLHPALGGCFGGDCLVSYGTDLVGDDYTGFNTPVPDDDPMDCYGHGTHVAGIVAAQENEYGFTGSAPDVSLGAYRVFGCDGEASNDVLIAAYNQAYEDGSDIITASIGGPSGWTEEPWAVAVSRIVEKGVPCLVSAGNDGQYGLFYASTAANGKGVTAVASFVNTNSPTLLYNSVYTVDGGEDVEFGYTPGSPSDWEGVNLPLWAPSFEVLDPAGGCDPYPEDTPDLSGYIVLIRRGSCTFVQKAQNAADHGAQYIMLYNNGPGTGAADVSAVPEILALAMVTPEMGETWINGLADGQEIVLDMTGPDTAEQSLIQPLNPVTGGSLNIFTSWGPTYEGDVKPQIGAPGGNILSTYPRAKGSYAVLSGTSMACPLTAAVVALIGQARGTLDPTFVENLLSANANPQLFNAGSGFSDFYAPVVQQGGGLLQAYDAVHATTTLSPSSLAFNDTKNFVASRNFTIENIGDEEITYQISHVPAITMFTFDSAEDIYPAAFPNEPTEAHAEVEFSTEKQTLAPGESVVIEVMPTPPSGLDAARVPVWSGYIAINGTDGSSLSMPYMGITGDLHDHSVLADSDAWVARSNDDSYTPTQPNTTWTIPAPGSPDDGTTVFPAFIVAMALGSPLVHVDLVPLTTCPPNSTTEVWGGSIKSIGEPEGFPLQYAPREFNRVIFRGKLADGSVAPAGKYKFVVHALRIYGDAEDEDEYDVAESPSFRIVYE
jgi:subtilisin family serine protease